MKHTIASAVALAHRFLAPGDAALEIGAADGAYTCVYADQVGPTGFVLAVEPHRGHLHVLRETCAARPWVTIWAGAAGETPGARCFHADRTDPRRSSLWVENVPDPGKSYAVAVTTIDALVRTMPRVPTLIHIDAQGAEAGILAGALTTLALPVVWVIEVWAEGLLHAGASVDAVFAPFQARAYTPRTVRGHRLDWATAQQAVATRPYADLVMVPAPLQEAEW